MPTAPPALPCKSAVPDHSLLVWPHGLHIYTLWLALFIVAAGMFYIASRNYLRHRGVLPDKDDEEE